MVYVKNVEYVFDISDIIRRTLGVRSKYIGKFCKILQRLVGNEKAHGTLHGLPMFAILAKLLSETSVLR